MRDWNRADIATVLGTDRLRVADLRYGRLTRFSLETLMRLFVRAGYEVELRAEPRGPLARTLDRR